MKSNNRFWYDNCPALMSDSRLFTNYLPNRMLNDKIKEKLNINSNLEYKNYLINNAKNILNNERQYLKDNSTCTVRCANYENIDIQGDNVLEPKNKPKRRDNKVPAWKKECLKV